MPSSAARLNSSRRQILRTYTERAFYPEMTAASIPYDARHSGFGVTPSTAEAIGGAVGTVGAAIGGAALDIAAARDAQAAQVALQRAEAQRAAQAAKTAAQVKAMVPWIVGGVVVLGLGVFAIKQFTSRSS